MRSNDRLDGAVLWFESAVSPTDSGLITGPPVDGLFGEVVDPLGPWGVERKLKIIGAGTQEVISGS